MAKDWSKLFAKYKGQWVALKDDETTVVAHGNSAKNVLNKAAKSGFTNPILFKVPTKLTAYVGNVKSN